MARGWRRDLTALFLLPFRMRFPLAVWSWLGRGSEAGGAVIWHCSPRVAHSELAWGGSARGLRLLPFVRYSSYNRWTAPCGGAREAVPTVSPTSQCQHCAGSRDMWHPLWKTGKNKRFPERKLFLSPWRPLTLREDKQGQLLFALTPLWKGPRTA